MQRLNSPEQKDQKINPLLDCQIDQITGGIPKNFNKSLRMLSEGQTTPTINQTTIIVTRINTQIRNYYSTITTTTPTSCTTPQERTIPLGPGTMASKGMRVLAVFDPCRLVDGGTTRNLPNNNLKLLAVDLKGSGSNVEVHKAVVMELQRIQRITNDQILYNVGFTGTVTGGSPITDNTDTIQDINALFLWNDSTRRINFVSDNSISLNAILS